MSEKRVFVEPSAAASSSKLVNNEDGTTHVVPGKAHEAREGTVTNPGVRSVGGVGSGPQCPVCHSTGKLRMHPNKPEGERVYCINPGCSYDQSKNHSGITDVKSKVNVVDTANRGGTGVKVLRQSGPNN